MNPIVEVGQHLLPVPPQRHKRPPLHAYLPVLAFNLSIGPPGDPVGGGQVMGQPRLLESPWKIVQPTDIPLVPAPEMGHGGQAVSLAAVTGAVGQDEVVAQVQGIAAPGNEMVTAPEAFMRRSQ